MSLKEEVHNNHTERASTSSYEERRMANPVVESGNPAPLALGAVAVTLISVSTAEMAMRGLEDQTLFVANLCFIGCFALLISAQWAMTKGDTFSYTVLMAYGLFYAGYGAIMIPWFGVKEAYGGFTSQFYNSFGMFLLIWGVFNLFFLICSIRINLVYILLFTFLELCLVVDAASQFKMADGDKSAYYAMQKAAGSFEFLAGLVAFYGTGYYMFDDAFGIQLPMGDTSRYFARSKAARLAARKQQ